MSKPKTPRKLKEKLHTVFKCLRCADGPLRKYLDRQVDSDILPGLWWLWKDMEQTLCHYEAELQPMIGEGRISIRRYGPVQKTQNFVKTLRGTIFTIDTCREATGINAKYLYKILSDMIGRGMLEKLDRGIYKKNGKFNTCFSRKILVNR